MVYSDGDNPKPDRGFEDPTPQSDNDRYDEPSNAQRIDGTYLPRPFIVARLLGLSDEKVAIAINRSIAGAQQTLGRPPTAEEATAVAYWTAKHISVFSYGPALGFAGGLAQSYKTAPSFKFPLIKPDLDTFNPKVFPSAKSAWVTGTDAIAFWHVTRAAAYSTVGILVGTMFFGLYSSSIASVGLATDKRLKDYVEHINRSRHTPGAAPSPSQQPVPPVHRGKQTEPVVQATGDDASPNADTYWGMKSNEGPLDGGLLGEDAPREPQLSAQGPVRATPRRAAQQAPAARREPSYGSGSFDDASPTGGVGVTDEIAPGESAWERLRRQGISNAGSSQSSQQPQADASAQNGWGNGATMDGSAQASERRQMSAREIAQREFDELVERERQGGSFSGRG